jgi:hypothetical protein
VARRRGILAPQGVRGQAELDAEAILDALLDEDDQVHQPERVQRRAGAEQGCAVLRRQPLLLGELAVQLADRVPEEPADVVLVHGHAHSLCHEGLEPEIPGPAPEGEAFEAGLSVLVEEVHPGRVGERAPAGGASQPWSSGRS